MSEEKFIPVITQVPIQDTRSVLGGFEQKLAQIHSSVVSFELSALKKELSERMEDLSEMLADIGENSKGFKIESVTFTMSITTNGKIVLFGVAGGSSSACAGLQFTVIPTAKNAETERQ